MADDDKDMQALAELQGRVLEQTSASGRVQQQERMKATQKTRYQLTVTEISGMPDETVMYRSVGKAYFVAPKADIVSELDGKITGTHADIEALKSQKEVIDRKLQETENELRELVRASPSIVRKLGNVRIG